MKYKNAVPLIATADVKLTVNYYKDVLGYRTLHFRKSPCLRRNRKGWSVTVHFSRRKTRIGSRSLRPPPRDFFFGSKMWIKFSKNTNAAGQKYSKKSRTGRGTLANM